MAAPTRPTPDPQTTLTDLDTDRTREPALGISTAQVAGSALAAVSAAVLASWLGVAGTLIGAAVASVVGTVGSALYTHSLNQGGQVVVRRVVRNPRTGELSQVPTGASTMDVRPDETTTILAAAAPGTRRTGSTSIGSRFQWRELPWTRIAVGAVTVLVVALGSLTLIERVAGQPVSSLATGGDAGGTTLGRVVQTTDESSDTHTPTDEPAETPTDGESATPEPTVPTPTDPVPTDPVPTDPPPTEMPTEPSDPLSPSPAEPTATDGASSGSTGTGAETG